MKVFLLKQVTLVAGGVVQAVYGSYETALVKVQELHPTHKLTVHEFAAGKWQVNLTGIHRNVVKILDFILEEHEVIS